MSNVSFEIVRFTVNVGSGISPQRVYNTPSGQLMIPVEASICCIGPNDETLEILFPSNTSTNITNLAGAGPPVWGTIFVTPSSYLWYIDLLHSVNTVGYINVNNPTDNHIRADAYAKFAFKKSRKLYVESLTQELNYQKQLLKSLEIQLAYSESQMQQSSSPVNAYTVNHIKSMINAQDVAITAAEARKASAEEEYKHTY